MIKTIVTAEQFSAVTQISDKKYKVMLGKQAEVIDGAATGRYIVGIVYTNSEPTLEEVQELMIENCINAYDTQEGAGAVNNFYFSMGGATLPFWWNKTERASMISDVTTWSATHDTFELADREQGFTANADCSSLLTFLGELQNYAKECYDVTTAHIFAIRALESIEDVVAYDYTSGYPDNLVFSFDE